MIRKKDGRTYRRVGSFKPGEEVNSKYKCGTVIRRKLIAYIPVKKETHAMTFFNN